jgi:amino acid transporter
MGSTGFLPPAFARIEPRHATPNVAVTVVTAVTLGVALIALALHVTPDDIFNNCGTLSSFGFILIYALIAVAALVYCRRLGAMKITDLAISIVALAFLALATIWLFDSVSAPPQRWFGYYFIAFLAFGWLGLRAFSARAKMR